MFKNEIRLAYHLIRDINKENLTPSHCTYSTSFNLEAYCDDNCLSASDVNLDDAKAIQDVQSALKPNETLYVTHFPSNE